MSVKETVAAGYEAGDYREFWTRPSQQLQNEIESAVVNDLLPRRPGWIIDIGCGFGRLAPIYVGVDRPAVLLDAAPNLLERAAERLAARTNVHFVAADATRMPFRNSVFASGVSVRMFHHLDAPPEFLRELARVLRPNSPFVLSYSNKRNLLRILRHGRSCFREDHEGYEDTLFGTHPAWFERATAAAGLSLERCRGTGVLAQLASPLTVLDRLAARSALFRRGARGASVLADRIIGGGGLAPMNFALLRSAGAAGTEADRRDPLEAIVACPACHGRLAREAGGFRCEACKRVYPRRGPVLDFRMNPGE